MRWLSGILLCGVIVLLGEPVGPRRITLGWDYAEPSTNITFTLYQTTDVTVPLTNWVPRAGFAGTNLTGSITNPPGNYYFAMTASNSWGESLFSNVVTNTRLPLLGSNLTVRMP